MDIITAAFMGTTIIEFILLVMLFLLSLTPSRKNDEVKKRADILKIKKQIED